MTTTTHPRITVDKQTGLFVLNIGGPGNPIAVHSEKWVLEELLDYCENRTANDSLSLASEPSVDPR